MPLNTSDWSNYLNQIVATTHPLAHQIIKDLNLDLVKVNRYCELDYPEYVNDVTHNCFDQLARRLTHWQVILPISQQIIWQRLIEQWQQQPLWPKLFAIRTKFNFTLNSRDYDKYCQHSLNQKIEIAIIQDCFAQLQQIENTFLQLLKPS